MCILQSNSMQMSRHVDNVVPWKSNLCYFYPKVFSLLIHLFLLYVFCTVVVIQSCNKYLGKGKKMFPFFFKSTYYRSVIELLKNITKTNVAQFFVAMIDENIRNSIFTDLQMFSRYRMYPMHSYLKNLGSDCLVV